MDFITTLCSSIDSFLITRLFTCTPQCFTQDIPEHQETIDAHADDDPFTVAAENDAVLPRPFIALKADDEDFRTFQIFQVWDVILNYDEMC